MRKADNLTTFCAVIMKSGNLNFLEPSGPLQACNGTALPFLYEIGKIRRETVVPLSRITVEQYFLDFPFLRKSHYTIHSRYFLQFVIEYG